MCPQCPNSESGSPSPQVRLSHSPLPLPCRNFTQENFLVWIRKTRKERGKTSKDTKKTSKREGKNRNHQTMKEKESSDKEQSHFSWQEDYLLTGKGPLQTLGLWLISFRFLPLVFQTCMSRMGDMRLMNTKN